MQASKNCIELIKTFEGVRLEPYLCPAGVPTIGIGCTRYEDGKKVSMSDAPISEEKAEALLKHALINCERAVNLLITCKLTQPQFDALVSLVYNIGEGNFASSTLRKMLNGGLDKFEASKQFLRWNKSCGKELPGLTSRRAAEKEMFCHHY